MTIVFLKMLRRSGHWGQERGTSEGSQPSGQVQQRGLANSSLGGRGSRGAAAVTWVGTEVPRAGRVRRGGTRAAREPGSCQE